MLFRDSTFRDSHTGYRSNFQFYCLGMYVDRVNESTYNNGTIWNSVLKNCLLISIQKTLIIGVLINYTELCEVSMWGVSYVLFDNQFYNLEIKTNSKDFHDIISQHQYYKYDFLLHIFRNGVFRDTLEASTKWSYHEYRHFETVDFETNQAPSTLKLAWF